MNTFFVKEVLGKDLKVGDDTVEIGKIEDITGISSSRYRDCIFHVKVPNESEAYFLVDVKDGEPETEGIYITDIKEARYFCPYSNAKGGLWFKSSEDRGEVYYPEWYMEKRPINPVNEEILEALEYAQETIISLTESKPIKNLDERIAYFKSITNAK